MLVEEALCTTYYSLYSVYETPLYKVQKLCYVSLCLHCHGEIKV